jgi:Mlc titration factor MtfA (ptsG expression regulator)
MIYVFIISLIFLLWLIWSIVSNNKKFKSELSKDDLLFLEQHVKFYRELSQEKRLLFESAAANFLKDVRVEWLGTEKVETDRLLVAASAVIPIFGFPDWKYPNISSVIIYPDTFNHNFQFEGKERNILGMVGSGYMNRQMILSQQALRNGFSIENDGSNTGIHEFVHLLDKSDGTIDGMPEYLLTHPYVLPWINLVHQEIKKIKQGKSKINTYAATNESEFFAVIAEYFFEKPKQLKEIHPELYTMLEKIFKQNPLGF